MTAARQAKADRDEESANKRYALGVIEGKKRCGNALRDAAATAFARGLDKEALLLRQHADHITIEADGNRADYDKEYGENP